MLALTQERLNSCKSSFKVLMLRAQLRVSLMKSHIKPLLKMNAKIDKKSVVPPPLQHQIQ